MPDGPTPLRKISAEEANVELTTTKAQSASGPEYKPDDRVDYWKKRFREEWDKPFWQSLRENIPIDMGYYTGSGQWTAAQKSEAKGKNRPTLTINHVLGKVNALLGLERMNRYDPRAAPTQEHDQDVADLFTELLKQTIEETSGEYVLSQGFSDGCIGGVVAYELPIEYEGDLEDVINGTITFKTVRVPEELVWSTPWTKYDLSDCRAMWRHKWVDVDVLLSAYPKHREAIREALKGTLSFSARDATREATHLSEGNPKDHYEASDFSRPEDDVEFWYDVKMDRVRVFDVYYPEFFPVWILMDKDRKKVFQTTQEIRMRRFYADIVKRNPGGDFVLVERFERKIQVMTCLPATGHVLEEGEAFKKDPSNYPYIPFFAYWKRNEVFGVVRNLRDPQDEINARRSQISWLTKATGDGWFADEGSVVNLKSFEEQSRDPKGVILVKKNAKDPRRMTPPQVPQGLFQLLGEAINEMSVISGVPPEGQGLSGDTISGVAIERRKQGGHVVTTELFDNFKLTKKLIYKKMARRIQEVYTDEKVIRLKNPESGGFKFITINQKAPVQVGEGVPSQPLRYKVLNDISSLRYDIVMTETPASPTHRQGALATLLELIQKVPSAAEMLIDIIIDMTDGLPNKDEVVARFKQFVQSRMKPPSAPPPKSSISLKGEDLSTEVKEALARKALDQPDPKTERNPLGEAAGNAQNPSGQIPEGGQKLDERADLPPAPGG
jgi:hypothetical protein